MMEYCDRMTRRNFLARVTTLAGGIALASTGLSLAGCGGNSNSSGNGGNGSTSIPTPGQIGSSPGNASMATALPFAHQIGVTLTNTQTSTGKLVTQATPADVASELAALVASAPSTVPNPTLALPILQSNGTYSIVPLANLTDSSGASVSSASLQSAIASYLAGLEALPLSQGGIQLSSLDSYVYNTYTYGNQQTISVPAIVDKNGNIVFDPILSFLPPPETTTVTGPSGTTEPNPYVLVVSNKTGLAGAMGENVYNPATGSLLYSIGATATATQSTSGTLTMGNSQIGTPTTGPDITVAGATITTKAVPTGIAKTRQSGSGCITIGLTFTVSLVLKLPNGNTIDIWHWIDSTLSLEFCQTGTTNG